ncbi:MAG TPA: NADH-quinone oxidoreductase subunit J [Frankiaceae bacterium]|nr:NADH-quinone oxidoreductase subunit J [Frankiaceae bacterium]
MIDVLAQASTQTSTAEAVVFWVLAPIALGCAIAMIFARSAVHAALLLVGVFFCLAVFYAAQDAPFLAAVQIIVYTGAIMILFLFVLMLIGVDAHESLRETLRGHRIAAVVVGLGLAGVLVGAIGRATLDAGALGLDDANSGGNVLGIARHLFGEAGRNQDSYFLAFEMTSALLITAAIGAMVLTHVEKTKKSSQKEQAIARFKGTHPTPLSGPGVYATSHSEQQPALLPGGEPLEGSASPRVTGGDE